MRGAREGDEEEAAASSIGIDDGTSSSSRPPPPASSFLPPLNLRAAALRSHDTVTKGCLPLCGISGRPAAWEQSSPEERAWAAEVAQATAHLPPPSRLLPRETTAALVARAVEGGEEEGGGEAAALHRLKQRLDDAGLSLPTVTLSWQSLSVDRRLRQRRRREGKARANEPSASFPSLVSPFTSLSSDVASALSRLLFRRKKKEGENEEKDEEDEDEGKWLRVLDASTGVLRPGTTTLLLGPPGCGKTTLLRVLSGRLKPGGGLRIVNGDKLLYNGLRGDGGAGGGGDGEVESKKEKKTKNSSFSLARTVSFVAASDLQIPNLTVRETLRFAEECHGGDPTVRPLLESLVTLEGRRRKNSANAAAVAAVRNSGPPCSSSSSSSPPKPERDLALERIMAAICNPANSAATEWVLRVLRLTGTTADTIVGGDALHRGVSGGERRRCSTGELLVGAARALCLDEVSSGLDSSSTAALARSLRSSARDLGVAVIASFLAPEPDAVAAFDEVLLLAGRGKTLFHGPVEAAFPHFEALGLRPLPEGSQDVADFLLDVASREGRRALWEQGKGNETSSSNLPPPPPPSTAFLAEAFRASPLGKQLALAASTPFPRTAATDAELCRGAYAAPRSTLLRVLLRRAARVDLFSADGASAAVTRWLLALLMSLSVGSLFLDLPVSLEGGQARLAVLFFALFFVVTLAVPAIEVAHARKPVALRQRDDGFYPASLDVISQAATAVPVVAVDVCAATLPLYFLSGFSREPGRVASFVGIFFLLELSIDALNRALGVLSAKLNWGIAVGVCALLGLETTTGFTLAAGSIPRMWRWLHYLNPMAWAFRTLAVSEFGDARWDVVVVETPSQNSNSNSPVRLGEAVLALFEVSPSTRLAWGGAAFLFGYYLIMVAVGAVGLSLLRAPEPAGGAGGAEEEEEEEKEKKEGGGRDAVAVSVAPLHLPPPPPRLSLAAINLSYFVPAPKKEGEKKKKGRQQPRELRLLDSVTASFEPGSLTALMGPSGAGKTTLLDVLAFRKTSGRVSFAGKGGRGRGNGNGNGVGGIFVGGARAEARSFSAVAAYVEQSADSHFPLLSVSESVLFSASLRLPASTTREAVRAAAEEALAVVGLGDESSNLLVGSLPLERRKRLSIAVELAARPSILFLDEPTSGLDGRAAATVAGAMRAAADSGRTVVSTIHQPSRQVFALFDGLLLLAPGGKVAFCGDLGGGKEAPRLVEHFLSVLRSSGKIKEPREDENRAAWAMEALSVLEEEKGEEEEEGGEISRPRSAAASAFPNSATASLALAAARRASEDGRGRGATPPPRPRVWSFFKQHSMRAWRGYHRDPGRNTSRFLVTAVIALIISTMEAGKGKAEHVTSLKELNNALGLLYLVAVVLSMDIAFEAQPFLSAERLVYFREKAAGAALAGPQMLSAAVVELPYLLAQTMVFAVPVYLAVGYERSAAKFGFFALVSFFFFFFLRRVF